jgi:hypothetical protein
VIADAGVDRVQRGEPVVGGLEPGGLIGRRRRFGERTQVGPDAVEQHRDPRQCALVGPAARHVRLLQARDLGDGVRHPFECRVRVRAPIVDALQPPVRVPQEHTRSRSHRDEQEHDRNASGARAHSADSFPLRARSGQVEKAAD